MTISYPLDLGSDWPLMATTFSLRFRQSLSRTGAGKVTAVDLGYPVWVGTFQTANMSHADCVEFEAVLNALGGAAEMVKLGDTRREYPKAYLDGDFTDMGEILAIDGDGIRISLGGLDAGFVISRGDYFTMLYGGERYLLQAAEAVTADGSGETALFQTSPAPPYGLTVTQAVKFKTPTCRMRIEPGSLAFNDNEDGTGSVSFAVVQS